MRCAHPPAWEEGKGTHVALIRATSSLEPRVPFVPIHRLTLLATLTLASATSIGCGDTDSSRASRGRMHLSDGSVALASTANIYSAAGAGALSPAAARVKPLGDVPTSRSAIGSAIDPSPYEVVRTLWPGRSPQHGGAAYDTKSV